MASRRRRKKETPRLEPRTTDPGPLAHQPFDVLSGLSFEAEPEPAPQAPQPAPEPKTPGSSDDSLFEQAMADVAPLRHHRPRKPRGPANAQPPETSPLEAENLEVLAHLEDLVGGRVQFDLADSDEYIEGYIKGIHPLILERLRQGLFSVQGHLDLHGLTAREAEAAVRDFIEKAAMHNQRCVLLVHGRGVNSKDHIPVLKRRLQGLLLKSSIRKRILAFTSARPHDGGTGASYVLLRTRR